MTGLDKGVDVPGGRLLAEEVSLPAAVLYEDRLAHNLRWMQSFASASGVRLAPHGKTTMAPKLFRRQMEAGAWAITVATAPQAAVAFAHGIGRVLVANLLIGRRNLELVAAARAAAPPPGELLCLVDSADAVAHLGRFFSARGETIDVLLELGPSGGRTGVRDAAQEGAVLRALGEWRGTVRLAGVEVFEGVLDQEAAICALLGRAVTTVETLAKAGAFAAARPILSGAGSAWYDVVAREWKGAMASADIVLRPGCYVSHDVGSYRLAQSRIEKDDPVARGLGPGLRPALQVWAYVLSVPEPRTAIVGFGKRDAAFDAGYPQPALRFRPAIDAVPRPVPPAWQVSRLMDQHAFLQIAEDDDVRVGEMLAFDISHPCLTFDKWRRIGVVDGDLRVIDVVETFF